MSRESSSTATPERTSMPVEPPSGPAPAADETVAPRTTVAGGAKGPEGAIRRLAAGLGIEIDGQRPFDIQVRDPRFYRRVLADGSLGLGESYMEGWWDCADLTELHRRILSHGTPARLRRSPALLLAGLQARLFNRQSHHRSPIVAREHYDRTTEAYRCMTDKWITLSCGYWKRATTLDEAQEHKLDLICRKIRLLPTDRVLDIGCGFGSFARFAAERYGCTVVGINVSKEQVEAARELGRGLPIGIHQCDYRETDVFMSDGPFDKVVSAGMFEHVGYKNYRTYMDVAHRSLKEGGLFLLHTIGSNVSNLTNDPWFDKYIFPNGQLPSIRQIGETVEGLFVVEDWHNFGVDYTKTLRAWFERFDANWIGSRTDTFYRMWKYYLLSAAGAFAARDKQLWQIVLSKGGLDSGYQSIR